MYNNHNVLHQIINRIKVLWEYVILWNIKHIVLVSVGIIKGNVYFNVPKGHLVIKKKLGRRL